MRDNSKKDSHPTYFTPERAISGAAPPSIQSLLAQQSPYVSPFGASCTFDEWRLFREEHPPEKIHGLVVSYVGMHLARWR